MIAALAIMLALLLTPFLHSPAWADDGDGIDDWRRLPSIEAAVILRDLDGPDDIIEKAEIIEDRVDDLGRFADGLQQALNEGARKLESWKNQKESLEELATIKITGDAQTTDRLRDIAARIRREESMQDRRAASLKDLTNELAARRSAAAVYRQKAEELRLKEGGGQ